MKTNYLIPILLLVSSLLSGCELIGDIFQAGMYVGVFIVIAIVIALIWLVRFFSKRRG